MTALTAYTEIQREELTHMLSALSETELEKAARIIWQAQEMGGRVHVTGIGKPSYVAGYIASLLSSTGTPAYYLHGTEAVHGSCGQLVPQDVVICISNSGETEELKATAAAVRRNGCKVLAVTGNADSWLARFADFHLCAAVNREGGPLNCAPRASILAELLVLQALSIVLQEHRSITLEEYVLRHPGGVLGTLRTKGK